MEIIDNVNKTLKDDMLVTLRSGSKVAIAASCFSIYAFQELKEQPSDAVTIPLVGLNLDAVWQHVVAAIGDMEVAEGNSLDEQIYADDERAKLLKRIEMLERQMRAMTQKHRQRELYAEIKKLKQSINEQVKNAKP